jgi:hypothetical protein
MDRCVDTLSNDAVLDRRLHELEPVSRMLLALIAHSRQPRWTAGSLLEMLAALGHAEGMRPVLALMDEGLLYPDIHSQVPALKGFEQWMCQASATGHWVFTHPHVMARAVGWDLGIPTFPDLFTDVSHVREFDGLDWLIRLAVVWQHATSASFRQTQQGDLFKRDLERLRADPLLSAPLDATAEIPDAPNLTVALGRNLGILTTNDNELRAGALPADWELGSFAASESLWTSLLHVNTWNSAEGTRDLRGATNPYPAAYLLALLYIARLPDSAWIRPSDVETWVLNQHPYWEHRSLPTKSAADAPMFGPFLLGLAPQFGLLRTAKTTTEEPVISLSRVGRALLGAASAAALEPAHTKTLLVQPNLEIVAYRQGLTPSLVGALSKFASWKSIGPACTLQLQPDTVYRALEAGWTCDSIVQLLDQHGTRPTPPAVIESLRTWSNKRERLQVYSNAVLFEFHSTEQLETAVARGLPGVRVSERLLLVPNERVIDYRHFKLIGTRDYSLPPDRCVDVDSDGVTLNIDPARSDLLLETELGRFAECLRGPGVNGRPQYQLTPSSLAAGRERGVNLQMLESWFEQRTGRPLTPAGRLLLAGPMIRSCEINRPLVLHVETAGIADGLIQWPGTRHLIEGRLGPTALIVAEGRIEELRAKLLELGLSFQA